MVNDDGRWMEDYDYSVAPLTAALVSVGLVVGVVVVYAGLAVVWGYEQARHALGSRL